MDARWTIASALALVVATGCSSGTAPCSGVGANSYGVEVLAPDGSQICDAVVTEDGQGRHQQLESSLPFPDASVGDAGCYYLSFAGAGTYVVTASKPGYLDAHATEQVRSTGGQCSRVSGGLVTLHLVPASDGGIADAGAGDAGS